MHTHYPTDSGYAYLSEKSIFREKDLHNDFTSESWFELNLYGITGREFTEVQLKILNYIWRSTSYSDIRIWPNRIAALAGTTRSTALMSIVGGLSSCDAELFVTQPLVNCLVMYQKMEKLLTIHGQSLEFLIQQKLDSNETIFGFGRPITSVDERVPHFVSYLNRLGCDKGFHFKLAFKIEAILKAKKNIQMNIAALYSAVLADLEFNKTELSLFVSLLVVAGMPPCYLDAQKKPPGTFLPIKCSDINFVGEKDKSW
ncbi:hypothetical protein [Aliikangiella maris]|uniref:Uncharacterized protein n=2 Tax=Aliikangiella maris TaxID=3162458 RepID=A0ABV3MI33_9GAMM